MELLSEPDKIFYCVACQSREARFGELCPECKAELDGDTSDVGSQ